MHAYSPILAPVVALVAWTLLVMLWMFAARFAAFKRVGITLANAPRGARGGATSRAASMPRGQWKSHNYNHLMEQPTLFYAIALTLALMNFGGGINYWLAWGYVGFRILHSLVQATVNVVRYRFACFRSGLVLPARADHARRLRILHDCGHYRLKQAASSTWVDQRNWPTGLHPLEP